jgi:hypothetical protein
MVQFVMLLAGIVMITGRGGKLVFPIGSHKGRAKILSS